MTGRYGTQDAALRRADLLRYRGVPAALHAIIREARTAETRIERVLGHQTTAAQAAAAPTPTEDRMSLLTIEEAVKNDLTQGVSYVKEFMGRLEQAAPGIIATAEKYQNSPVVQALEAAFLTPAEEQQIAGFINMLAAKKLAAPADPAQPVQA